MLCIFPLGLSTAQDSGHAIILKEGTLPISICSFHYPQILKDEIEQLVVEMLATGIIQPSKSPFSKPVLPVKKKDGCWRFYVDYQATLPDKFFIPIIEELLDELHGATIFRKTDLKSGYHHIRISAEDVPKAAFSTHSRHEFLVMLFVLSNAPSNFQSLMNGVFRKSLRKFAPVFFMTFFFIMRNIYSWFLRHSALTPSWLRGKNVHLGRIQSTI